VTAIHDRIAAILRSQIKVGLKTDMGTALVFRDGLDAAVAVLVNELGLTQEVGWKNHGRVSCAPLRDRVGARVMTNIHDRITVIQLGHPMAVQHHFDGSRSWHCRCGHSSPTEEGQAAHVAEVLVRELGWTEEEQSY
jgi:hypothetical protein